jgi:phosphoglycolate phosphatase
MRFRGIIFDCDGVLIMNTNQIYDEALISTVRFFKPKLSDKGIQRVMHRTRGKTFVNQLKILLGSEHPLLEEAINHYEKYLHRDDIYRRISLLDGVDKVLFDLKSKGYILGMVTGMNPSLLDRLFRDGILPGVFQHIENVHKILEPQLQKPHPKILIDLIDVLELLPEEAAFVGDTVDDIEMAKKAGVFSIAVLTGRLNKQRALAIGSDLVIKSALELIEWI